MNLFFPTASGAAAALAGGGVGNVVGFVIGTVTAVKVGAIAGMEIGLGEKGWLSGTRGRTEKVIFFARVASYSPLLRDGKRETTAGRSYP